MEKKINNSAVATAKSLRVSPRKLNLVASSIRGLKVSKALTQLDFSSRRIALEVKKCLQSAVANAENNFGLDLDNLHIVSATVGKALVMKRVMARARGRSAGIKKFFSNLYITVAEKESIVVKERK